jgi:hypothetical protein
MYLCVTIWSLMFFGFALGRAQDPPPSEAPNLGRALTSAQLSEMMTKQMQQAMAANTLRERKAVDRLANAFIAMESVSSEAFEAAWKIDFDIQQQPARGELERLFAELGLRMGNAEEHAAALDKPVSLQLQGVSRLQAIEQLCGQIGVYPDYTRQPDLAGGGPFAALTLMVGGMASGKMPVQAPAPEPAAEGLPAVVLRAGARPVPLVFTGPFALEVTRLEEYPPDTTGLLGVNLFLGGIHPSAQAYWTDGDWRQWFRPIGMVFFGKWRDVDGLGIVPADDLRMAMQSSALLPGQTSQVPLRNLLRDVKTVRLATEISVPYPTKVETIRFDDLTVTPITSGETTAVTIRSVKIQPTVPATNDQLAREASASIVVEAKCRFGAQLSCVVLDAEGQVLRGLGSGYSMDGYYAVRGPSTKKESLGQLRGDLKVQGVPKTLVVKVLSEEQKFTFPVELNVSLKSSSEQVEKLAELKFDGPCPVELETLKISKDRVFWEADVQVTNHSNKNVANIQAKMEYLDREGKKLSEQTAMLQPMHEPRQKRFLMATPKSTRKTEVTAFFAPDELASIRFVLESVTFGDGTTWKPQQP